MLVFCSAAVVVVAACGALLSFNVLQTRFRCVRGSRHGAGVIGTSVELPQAQLAGLTRARLTKPAAVCAQAAAGECRGQMAPAPSAGQPWYSHRERVSGLAQYAAAGAHGCVYSSHCLDFRAVCSCAAHHQDPHQPQRVVRRLPPVSLHLQSLWAPVLEKHASGLTAELLSKVFAEVRRPLHAATARVSTVQCLHAATARAHLPSQADAKHLVSLRGSCK